MIEPMVALHPQYIRSDGKDEFVVLPAAEFTALCERLEDLEDLRLLDQARAENGDKPGISIEQLKAELGIN